MEQALTFDVVCAGEALWHLAAPGQPLAAGPASLRFRPGGGAMSTAIALANHGLRVGLATALADDQPGRALRAIVAAAGVDVSGVELAAPRAGIVFLDGKGLDRPVASYRDEERSITIPTGWTSSVLFLAGLSPIVANAASLCKAARAARRVGTIVVVDVNARWHLWAGRDARATRMTLREADVVHCSTEDLSALDLDEAAMRASMRPTSVLVVTNAMGDAWATGPFGEVGQRLPRTSSLTGAGRAPEAFTAAICAELARRGEPAEHRGDLWHRTLQRGHAAAARA